MTVTHKRQPARPPAAGFSLIEILVVISIIAILIGITVPILARGKTTAKVTSCMSNVRSISQAMGFYTADSRGAIAGGYTKDPTNELRNYNLVGKAGTGSALGHNTPNNKRMLYNYLPAPEVARCPLDTGYKIQLAGTTRYDYSGSSYRYISRSIADINAGKKLTAYDTWVIEGHRVTEVEQPVKKLLISDDIITYTAALATDSTARWHGTSDDMSVGFLDQHAEQVKRKTSGANAGLNNDANITATDAQIRGWMGEAYY